MNSITRRPFLLLSFFIAGAALLQAIVGAESAPAGHASGELPAGMVCTTCGPIYSAGAPRLLLAPGDQP